MKTITFYLDFISPYAWLAFHAWPQALQGIGHQVVHKPVLFGAMLQQLGHRGPAELPGKREWTYRQVLWLARQQACPLDMPASHPFNPLALLRLALACDPQFTPNRHVCEQVFRHVWCGGAEAADPQRLTALTAQLAPVHAADSPEVKQALQAHTAEALALGVFGVPTFAVDGRLFWGQDALPMLRAYLQGDPWFDGPDWQAPERTAVGVVRQPR